MTRRIPTIGVATPAELRHHQTKAAAESYVQSSTNYPSTTTVTQTQPKHPNKQNVRRERFANHGIMPRKDCLMAAKKKAQELKEHKSMKKEQAKAEDPQAKPAERDEAQPTHPEQEDTCTEDVETFDVFSAKRKSKEKKKLALKLKKERKTAKKQAKMERRGTKPAGHGDEGYTLQVIASNMLHVIAVCTLVLFAAALLRLALTA